MASPPEDLWQALLRGGASAATEEEYEHGYVRRVREDLRRYVAFRVTNELHGLPIDCIEEVSKVFDTTPVPQTADFVVGIGSVRGNMIPVVDLPTRLGLRSRVRSRGSRVLIVRHQGELYGLVVDQMVGVVSVPPEDLEEAPSAIGEDRSEFIEALTRYEGEILVMLDLDTLLDPRDFVPVRSGPEGG